MAPPTWVVGQVLTASDVNNWFVPLAAYRTSTQSVTSSITLVNDTQLFVSVAANAVYAAELMLLYDGDTAGDLKFNWTLPSGASLVRTHSALTGAAATGTDDQMGVTSGDTIIGCLGAGTTAGAVMFGTLTTSAASGTCQLQWAQNASSVTATRVFAGSRLILTRVG